MRHGNARQSGSVVAALLPRIVIGAGVVGGVLLQAPLGRANSERRRNDFRYTPDADVVRILSCGHRSTLADAIWLRALPDFSREFDDLELKARWLNGVFDVAVDLEPTFYTAYSYGSTYLSLIKGENDRAIALLERGVATYEEIEAEDGRQYPGGTRLRIDLAMAYYSPYDANQRDIEKTLEHLDIAVARPDCDFLTRGMRVGLALKDGHDLVALTCAARNADHEIPHIREKAQLELERTKLKIAQRCHRDFVTREGRVPESIDELRDASEIDPAAAAVVFPAVVYDENGVLEAPALAALELQELIRSLEWVAYLHHKNFGGKWPDVGFFFDRENNPYLVISPDDIPEGMHIEIADDGAVTVVPD